MGLSSHLERRHRVLYGILGANFALFGVTLTIVGATLPEIIRTFGWSYLFTGAVLAAGSIGYFSSTFLTGLLMHRFHPRASMLFGLLLCGASLLFFVRFPSGVLNMGLFFTLGVGQGIVEVVTNYEVITLEREGESGLMTLLHALFTLGAAAGPFFVGAMLNLDLGWSIVYRASGIMAFAMGIPFSLASFQGAGLTEAREVPAGDEPLPSVGIAPGPPTSGPRTGGSVKVLGRPFILACFLIILLYVGSELGIANWVAEYFVADLGTSAASAAYMASILWGGILAGRLMLAFIFGRARRESLLLCCAFGCSLFFFLALLWRAPHVVGGLLFFTGLGYSGIYPLVMSLAGRRSPGGVAVGFISTGGGIGSFVFPFVLAFIAGRTGLRGGFVFCLALNCTLAAAALALFVLIRRERKGVRG